MLREFAAAREWDQYHTPKNLAAAMSVEAAEVLEHFQWLTDEQSLAIDPARRTAVSHELADVLLYLIRLADKLGIDLVCAAREKIAINAAKYPVERVRGSARNTTSSDDAALFRDVQGLHRGIAAQPDCERLKGAFFSYYRYHPSPAEVNSWRNSLRAMADVLQIGGLQEQGVLLEYQLPLSSKRLDCMLCGTDDRNAQRAVIVELKQWDRCESADPENVVRSWVGGRHRTLLHPSVQVGHYRQYLEDTHTAFHEGPNPIVLSACSISAQLQDRGR